jgi:hypothetical protein|tara:strand:+ start:484 stop:696 length:213 start_codon:yes stop_codon:yes gene_type:complete
MNWEWDKETQKQFEEMQEKCREFSQVVEKFRDDVTRNRDDMQTEDSAVSKFEHQVDMMAENFRRMKHNCF